MMDDDLDLLLGQLSAPAASSSTSTPTPAAGAISELDAMLSHSPSFSSPSSSGLTAGALAAPGEDENVDSLLAELEDTRQSLLFTHGNSAVLKSAPPISVKSAPTKPHVDVLGEADRLLYALSVHGIAPVSSGPILTSAPHHHHASVGAAGDDDDAEFDGLLSALDAPPPAAVPVAPQRTVSSSHYGNLPNKPAHLVDAAAAPLDDYDEIGALLNDLEEPAPSTDSAAVAAMAESARVLKAVLAAREEYEAAVGDTVFAAQEQTGTLDDAILTLSTACRAFVTVVREERRAFDDASQQRLGESLLVISKGTKGLALAAQAFATVPAAAVKLEGILEILQKQLEKIWKTVQDATTKTR